VTNEKAGLEGQLGPAATETPDRRNDMDINVQHASDIAEWSRQIREIHDAIGPIGQDDPRFLVLVDRLPGFGLTKWTPEELTDPYWTRVVELPEFPVPAPGWAVSTEILRGSYPEVTIEWQGREHTMMGGHYSVRLEQSVTVMVDDFENFDGTIDRRGNVVWSEPYIFVSQLGDGVLSAAAARSFAIALADATEELERWTVLS
jgi:hypothetical protein